MFSKNTEKLESFIGENTSFQGDLSVKGTLRIDGRIEGRLNVDCLVLSETAIVKGEATAKRIVVGGKMEGNLRAQEIIEIKSTGKVWGDIFTPKFSLMVGGEFNGKVQMKTDESRLSDFEADSRKNSILFPETFSPG